MKRSIWVLLSVATFSAISFADTTFVAGGAVAGNWSALHSPYVIQGSINVPANDTLFIHEGVRVYFSGRYVLGITGVLEVLGTEQDSVYFTTDTTLTNPLRWYYLGFGSSDRISHLRYCVIENAGAFRSGAPAVAINNCRTEFVGVTVRDCGWAIRCQTNSFLLLDECVLERNEMQGGCGHAIRLESSQAELNNTRITRNSALDGGAICIYSSRLFMESCYLNDNLGYIWGGVMYVADNSDVTATNCIFEGNKSLMGGAIDFVEGDSLILNHCLFLNNSSSHDQYNGQYAAMSLFVGTHIIDNCTFVGNLGLNTPVIGAEETSLFTNCIFAYNRCPWTLQMHDLTVVGNSLFFHNQGANFSGSVPNDLGRIVMLNLNGDSCDALYNLFMDPLFVDTAISDFHLSENSPCIDAGNPDSPLDPDSTISDIGAYPYFQETSTSERPSYTPTQFAPYPAYPNPFNASTTLNYELPQATRVSLKIYNLLGQEVASLLDENQTAGRHQIIWTAESVPSGMYVASLQSGNTKSLQKLLLLK